MMKVYFTFGSDPRYPYGRDQYVVAEAETLHDAVQKFRHRHPDRTPGLVNCAFFYQENEFNKFRHLYDGAEPAEVIR